MPRKNKIIFRTGTGAPSAADFVTGEPGFDSAAGTLYIKNAAGSMAQIAGGGGGATEIYEFASASNFPATGAAGALYIDKDRGKVFRWETSVYVELGPVGGGAADVGSLWSTEPVTHISDLAFWGSAESSSTLTISGSTVTEWRDRAGGSVSLSSIVGTPTLESAAINSKPAVLFDGTSAIYGNVFDGLAKSAPFTLFCVIRPTATTFSGMDSSRVCCFGGTATSDFCGLIQLSEYDSSDGTRPYFFGGNSTAVYAGDFSPYLRGSALAITTKFMVYAFDGTNAVLYENGVVKGTHTAVHSSLSCNASSTAVLSLGAQRGPSNVTVLFGKCRIAEVGVYRKALSQAEVNALNGYFASLYATA